MIWALPDSLCLIAGIFSGVLSQCNMVWLMAIIQKRDFIWSKNNFLAIPNCCMTTLQKHPAPNVLYPKTNWPKKQISIFCTRLTLADGYAVYLWHLLGNPWAGITFPPKEVTTDASGCICVSKWTNGWEFIWEADLWVFVSGGLYQLNQNCIPGALITNTAIHNI